MWATFFSRNTKDSALWALSPFLTSSIMLAAALQILLFSSLVQATKGNLDAGAMRGEPRLVGSPKERGLLSETGCFFSKKKKKKSAGVSWPRVRFWLSLLQDCIKTVPALLFFYSFILFHHPNKETSIGLLQGDLSRNRKACHTEMQKKRRKKRQSQEWSQPRFKILLFSWQNSQKNINLALEPTKPIPPPAMLSP